MDLARDAASKFDLVEMAHEQERWLALLLKWVFENQSLFQFPLGTVQEIYGEFGCPESIETFVAFLPPKDGWDPTKHSSSENEKKLYENWEQYLRNAPSLQKHLP